MSPTVHPRTQPFTHPPTDQLPHASHHERRQTTSRTNAGVRQSITCHYTNLTPKHILTRDQHMNLVLADCEEFRKVKRKSKAGGAPGAGTAGQVIETEEKRMLGLAIVRGATVVSCSVDGPPPSDPAARLGTSAPGGAPATMQAGPGISRPAGRGAGMGLQGPAAGVGGPGFGGPPAGFPGRGGPPRKFT